MRDRLRARSSPLTTRRAMGVHRFRSRAHRRPQRRTPSAVGMKACNFASLDPVQRARNIRGLTGASEADRALWREFEVDAERVAAEAEAAHERVAGVGRPVIELEEEIEIPVGPTEVERMVRV